MTAKRNISSRTKKSLKKKSVSPRMTKKKASQSKTSSARKTTAKKRSATVKAQAKSHSIPRKQVSKKSKPIGKRIETLAKLGIGELPPVTAIRFSQSNISTRFSDWDDWKAAEQISRGLETEALYEVKEFLDLTDLELSQVVQISKRTLSRRKEQETLPPDESDRVYRLAKLIELATDVFGSEIEARDWMKEPNYALAERTPLQLLISEPGATLVERLLGQIRFGIPI